VAEALRGIESGAAVHQAAVVHHEELARLQQETDLELRRAQQVSKARRAR
jgi:hypothetical protein